MKATGSKASARGPTRAEYQALVRRAEDAEDLAVPRRAASTTVTASPTRLSSKNWT